MQHSGPSNGCPLCGRTTGDYCRWDDEKILCYRGQSLGPPDVAIGEVIDIAGEQWALAKTDCGFANNSSLFVRHDPSTSPRQLSPVDLQRSAVALMLQHDQFERDSELAHQALQWVEALPEWEILEPDQVRDALELCHGSHALFRDLLVRCRRLRRKSPDIGEVAGALQDGLKAIHYQQKDLHGFWFDVLKDPGGGHGQQLAQQLKQEASR